MRAVAIRLEGPLQAWGCYAMGDDRPTLDVPTKSGVLGLVAACIGIERNAHERLFALAAAASVHIRVDRAGTRLVDDQTIQGLDKVKLSNGQFRSSATRATIQSKRGYLADASFVAMVVTKDEWGDLIEGALRAPRFAPFLGRRGCPPAMPLLEARCEAADPISLFESVAYAGAGESIDYFLDGDALHLQQLVVVQQRDALRGPLARQFQNRAVSHVRLARQTREGV